MQTARRREASHSFAVPRAPELSHGVIFHGRDPFEQRTLEFESGGRERRENITGVARAVGGDSSMRGFRRAA